MLTTLSLNNFILFNSTEIDFKGDFTVITGESGSGKSMLIDALKFLLGEKYSSTDDLNVSGLFDLKDNKYIVNELLEENGIDFNEDVLTIRRLQTKDGKNKILVNDNIVTIKFLKRLANLLVEFHNQQDQLEAFKPENIFNIIDKFIVNKDLPQQVAKIYKDIKEVDFKIDEAKKKRNISNEDLEYLKAAYSEIKSLNIFPMEEENLIEKKKAINEKYKILSVLKNINQAVDDENGFLSKILSWQREISRFESLAKLNESVESLYLSIDNLSREISEIKNNLGLDENLEFIEERLSKIRELSRKFRCNSFELNEKAESFEEEYNNYLNLDKTIERLEEDKKILMLSFYKKAESLSEERKAAISVIENKINEELKFLALVGVEIKYEFVSKQENISAKGIDQARLLLKSNAGFPFSEISKIASGGELSRIMLALKAALAGINSKIIIFDEIDAGTGGIVAETIGNRLKHIANFNQIISISHQPQVACKASQHLMVNKKNESIAESEIIDLGQEGRIIELAKMISGSETSSEAISVAKKLLSV